MKASYRNRWQKARPDPVLPLNVDSTPLWRRLASPRYWLFWSGLNLLRLLVVLPFAWQIRLGRAIGWLLSKPASRRRHIATVNLQLCFPELSAEQRDALLTAHFESLGIGLFETALAAWASDRQIQQLGRVEGLEHLEQALARGKGVILLTAHFIQLELGGRFVAAHYPLHVLYRPFKNPLYEAWIRRQRERHARLPALNRKDTRSLLRGLKQGHAVWYAPDQNYGPRHSIIVPFFGVPTLTITATSRLARLSGAAVVPYFPERLPGTAGYRVTILPALENFPSADDAADALRINQLIEGWIRRVPEQYLWVHRRFKNRPPELGDVYSN
jgi:KDO2-lipid IV(A) lauroyltransferase